MCQGYLSLVKCEDKYWVFIDEQQISLIRTRWWACLRILILKYFNVSFVAKLYTFTIDIVKWTTIGAKHGSIIFSLIHNKKLRLYLVIDLQSFSNFPSYTSVPIFENILAL